MSNDVIFNVPIMVNSSGSQIQSLGVPDILTVNVLDVTGSLVLTGTATFGDITVNKVVSSMSGSKFNNLGVPGSIETDNIKVNGRVQCKDLRLDTTINYGGISINGFIEINIGGTYYKIPINTGI